MFESNKDIIDSRNGLEWFSIVSLGNEFENDSSISTLTVSLIQKYSKSITLNQSELNQYFIFDVEPEVLFENFYGSLYQSKYRKPNENWKVFKIFKSELPSLEDLKKCKAIVISGSKRDVDGKEEYIKELIDFIKMVFQLQTMPKIVGICFGHQIVAYALGAKVERMDDLEKRANYFSFFEVKNIRLNHSFY